MKSITLVACNRPAYTQQVLDSIKANDRYGYHLFIAVEPGCQEVVDLCKRVDFMPTTVIENPTKLGINYNQKSAYERAFFDGSEFNVALEDDTVLAPDALDLANWFHALPWRDRYLLMNLFNTSKTAERPSEVEKTDAMCPWGWCFTRKQWNHWLCPNWMSDARGWDFSIVEMMRRLNFKSLTPIVSRTRNIGREGGANHTPELHDIAFKGLVMNDRPHTSFRVCTDA